MGGKRRVLTRRRFIATVGAVGGAAIGDVFVREPNRLEVTHHTLDARGSATSASPLRVAHLTDLHLQSVGYHEERIARALETLRPSMIVITGDSIDRSDRLDVLGDFLDLLDPSIPKFAVLGNWEYFCDVERASLSRCYERRGGRLLVNETAVHSHEGHDVLVTGLDDFLAGQPQVDASLQGREPTPHHLILAHCPMQRDYLYRVPPAAPGRRREATESESGHLARGFTPRCVLSGHTHGGQVNLFGHCPWRPWGSGPYVSGWYTGSKPDLFVSRGLGTTTLPLRLGAVPELPCLDWQLGNDRV